MEEKLVNPQTPMMKQYREIKNKHQDEVLFFRLGDFYEMFDEDAERVSKILNLTLTHRGKEKMCGIPFHAAKNYLKRLLDLGLKVALCEQFVEEGTKGIAKREVTQIFTPATVIDEEYLNNCFSSFVLAINFDKSNIYFSWADITTGEFYIKTIKNTENFFSLKDTLETIKAKEILVSEDKYFEIKEFRRILDLENAVITKLPKWAFSLKEGRSELEKQFSQSALTLFSLNPKDPILAVIGALLSYISEMSKSNLPQLRAIEKIDEDEYVNLNEAAIKNLELIESFSHDKSSSFFSIINNTLTPSGSRFLKSQVLHPLRNINKIKERETWIEYFVNNQKELDLIRQYLKEISDLERLSVKAEMKRLTPKDMVSIAQSVIALNSILEVFSSYKEIIDNKDLDLDPLLELSNIVDGAINKECTNLNNSGTIVNPGFDRTLDSLRDLKNKSSKILSSYLEKVKKETGLTIIKLGENKIIGNYLEVPKGQVSRVPEYFIRRQTLVGGERYVTNELNQISDEIIKADFQADLREKEIFKSFLDKFFSLSPVIINSSKLVTLIDFYTSSSYLALKENYVKPEMIEDGEMEITGGRHPVVESFIGRNNFVENSYSSKKHKFSLITGPNMAGKSTYLRQIALITLLSHMGLFVPAKSATIPIVDKIFCRVGASDNLVRGESTFLVEMSETAQILRSATRNSLVIMDEIGRGTSTQDGMSLAYAIMQYLIKISSLTLFATHYHELTLTNTENISLLHMLVEESHNQVIFLRRIAEGVSDSSYGIYVAKKAGLPREVISEANKFLKNHFVSYFSFDSTQGNLFSYSDEIENELSVKIESFDIENSSPLEALLFVSELKKLINEEK